jgi:uncharacterized membrane protein
MASTITITERPAPTDLAAGPAAGDTAGSSGNRSRLLLALLMGGSGVVHFASPQFYEQIVPRRFFGGREREVVYISGVAELVCAALLVLPPTRRLGAWLTLAVLIAVYPANIQMAIDEGAPHDARSWAAWIRLPLQVPMWTWAYRRATR